MLEHFLECSAKFREKIRNIGAKFDDNSRTVRMFAEILAKIRKKVDEFLRIFWVWSGSKCMKMFKILRNCMLLIANTWKSMKMHENVFRRCPSLCRRTPHRFCRVPCFPCSFFIFDFSIGSSSFVFFGIFREVFLQVVFHLGFQRCKGMIIL